MFHLKNFSNISKNSFVKILVGLLYKHEKDCTHPPRPSFSMYLFSPKPCKSRCGPEGNVGFGMCLHSHLHSQQAACGPYTLYSSFQREPCRSKVVLFTLGMGRDEHRHVCKRLSSQLGVQYCKLFLFGIIVLFSFVCS